MYPIALKSRREALGLTQSALANLLGNAQNTVSQWESGKRDIPDDVEDLLCRYERTAEDLIDIMLEMLEDSDATVLITHPTDESLWAAHPEMAGIPSVIHRVACARVAAECRSGGQDLLIITPQEIPPEAGH